MPKPDDEFRPPKVIDDAPLTIRFYGEVRGPRGTAATLVEMFDEGCPMWWRKPVAQLEALADEEAG